MTTSQAPPGRATRVRSPPAPDREPRGHALNALDRVASSFARISSPEPSRLVQLDSRLQQYDALNDLESRTGIRKSHWAILVSAFAMAFIFFGFGSSILCEWIGYLFPMYASFRCLDDRRTDRSDVAAWLMYWIVFVVYQSTEFIADSVLSRFPFYYPLKVVFVMWCLLPSYHGATTLYQAIAVPVGARLQNEITSLRHDLGDIAHACVVGAALHIRASLDMAMKRYPQIAKHLQ